MSNPIQRGGGPGPARPEIPGPPGQQDARAAFQSSVDGAARLLQTNSAVNKGERLATIRDLYRQGQEAGLAHGQILGALFRAYGQQNIRRAHSEISAALDKLL